MKQLHLISSHSPAARVVFLDDCSPPVHPVANRGLIICPHHIPHNTNATDGGWLMDCDCANVDRRTNANTHHIVTIFWAELWVSTICWRRGNNDFLSGTSSCPEWVMISCTEGKITPSSYCLSTEFLFGKTPSLHAHPDTYSDVWFLVMQHITIPLWVSLLSI